MSVPFEIAPFGEQALLISSDRSLVGYLDLLQRFGPARPGLTSVLVEGVGVAEIDHIRDALANFVPDLTDRSVATHSIAVTYDGPDLAELAQTLGVATDEVIARHTGIRWRVAMLGFSPGFAYLTSEESDFFDRVERLSKPRSRVPAGSVAIAAGMSAIYPSASPGGWQLIGSTTVNLFDVMRDKPALLAPGDYVGFIRQ